MVTQSKICPGIDMGLTKVCSFLFKIVVNALMYAIPAIFNVMLVCLVFWLIFSIAGVQIFKGKFYKCVNDSGERWSADIIPNKSVCLAMNQSWKNSDINFDNIFQGYLALFQVVSVDI